MENENKDIINTEAKEKSRFPKANFSKEFLRNTLAISIYNFGFNFLTTAEYVHFQNLMNDIGFESSTKISVLLSISLVALCFGAIFGGLINDKIRSRFGQRIPSIFLGTIIASFFILFIPLTSKLTNNLNLIYYLLLTILVISHLFLGAAYAPWLALVKDLFMKKERASVGIVINILSAAGAAIAVLSFSYLIEINLSWLVWIITGSMLLISTIVTSVLLPKNNPELESDTKISDIAKIPAIIWKYGGITWSLLIIVNAFWSFSSHLVETGLVDSLIERFQVVETTASLASNILMGAYIVILLFPTVWIINKIGKVKAGIITSLFYALFCILLALMRNFNSIYFIMIIGGIGNIFLSTLQIALPADLVPDGREASFMGVFFVFGTAMKPIATLIQGILLENKESQTTLDVFGGYPWVFLLAGIIVISTITLLIIIQSKTQEQLISNNSFLVKKKQKEKGFEIESSQISN